MQKKTATGKQKIIKTNKNQIKLKQRRPKMKLNLNREDQK